MTNCSEDKLEVIELSDAPKIRGPQDVWKILKPYADKKRESLFVIHMTPDMRARFLQRSAIGASQTVCFDTGDVLKEAILKDSKAIIIAHNHPYEDRPAPSVDDLKVTRNLWVVCNCAKIPLIDHMVFSHDDYYSMAEENNGNDIFPKASPYCIFDRGSMQLTDNSKSSNHKVRRRGYQSDFIFDCRK